MNRSIQINSRMLRQFAELIGDLSSLHTDSPFGRESIFHDNVVHGVLPLAFIPAPLNSELRALSARFAKPVYINDILIPEASSRALDEIPNELEEDFAFRHDSLIVNSGSARFAMGARHSKPQHDRVPIRTRIPIDCPDEQRLELNQIKKGDAMDFHFRVSPGHALDLRDIVSEGWQSNADAESSLAVCDPLHFLGACMLSTFVGMCIPGRQAVLLNFQVAFQQALEWSAQYRFHGEVQFKSESTSTLVETFNICHYERQAAIASGKITSLVQKTSEPSSADSELLLSTKNGS